MGQISSAPVELIRVQRCGGRDWRGAVAEMQGWRADHEDAHFMKDDDGSGFSVFGVLDGHGGCEAARLAAHDRLPALLADACRAVAASARDLGDAVQATFVETDAWLRTRSEVARDQSGSTCVVAGVARVPAGGYGAFVGNAGDSRGLLVRRGTDGSVAGLVASEDHKPDRPDELARIAAAGGFVSDADAARSALAATVVARLDGNLAVSRGLGDFNYKKDPRRAPATQKVSCVPELYVAGLDGASAPLQRGDVLILACDGVFDVMSNEGLAGAVVAALARGADVGDVCARLLGACLADLHSKDNMTLMVLEIGVDGTAYRYDPAAASAAAASATAADSDDDDDDDDDDDEDDDDDDDAAAGPVDEIVGLEKYDRQTDESVRRAYVQFLRYCEASGGGLPKAARGLLARAARGGAGPPPPRRRPGGPGAAAGRPAPAAPAPPAAGAGGGDDRDLDALVAIVEGAGGDGAKKRKKKKKKKAAADDAPAGA